MPDLTGGNHRSILLADLLVDGHDDSTIVGEAHGAGNDKRVELSPLSLPVRAGDYAIEGFRGDGLDHADAEAHATLALATMKGLIVDLAATGQLGRVRKAGALLSELLERS